MRGNQKSLPSNSEALLSRFESASNQIYDIDEAWWKDFPWQSTLEFAFWHIHASRYTHAGTHTWSWEDIPSFKLNWKKREDDASDRNCLSNENICWRDLSAKSDSFYLPSTLQLSLLSAANPSSAIKDSESKRSDWVGRREASDSLSSLGFYLLLYCLIIQFRRIIMRWNRWQGLRFVVENNFETWRTGENLMISEEINFYSIMFVVKNNTFEMVIILF